MFPLASRFSALTAPFLPLPFLSLCFFSFALYLGSTSKNGLPVRAKRVATMTSAVLDDIRDEVTCPICLELLTEPLSIDCGHSFCQSCITGYSDKSGLNQEGKSSCPVCQTTYQPGNLRPNRHLATIVKRLKEVVLGPGKQPEVILCALHGEKLQLFCKEDGKLICWLCERSQEHRGHHTFLMEEVAQEYQVGAGLGLVLQSRSPLILV